MATKRIDWYRATLFSVLGLIAAVGITALILGFIPVNSGLNTEDKPVQVVISNKEFKMDNGVVPKSYESFTNGDTGKRRETYDALVKEYERLTGFTILRGIVEGVGSPRAQYDKPVERSRVTAQTRSDKNEYFIFVSYGDKEQRVTLKNSDGENVSFSFDRVALAITEDNIIEKKYNVTAYAFLNKEFLKNQEDFRADSVLITANQINMYRKCAEILG